MSWIRHVEPENHWCKKPELTRQNGNGVDATASVGDLWACDYCGLVWIVAPGEYNGFYWARPSWFTQRKYAPRYACGCRIDKPQTKWCKKQPEPGARVHVIHGGIRPQ